ncbi:MAG: 50S ribosomal protein L10 [Gemmataceae bacterium]
MSKAVKQMQMDVLSKQFGDVKDMVVLTVTGIDAQTENAMRLALRKKNIRMQMVKNSLMRRVIGKGVSLPDSAWAGTTVIAWGGESVKGLSKEIETYLKEPKLKDKLKVKTAVAEGHPVAFELALKMPTRLEAIGDVVAAMLGAGSSIAGALTGPASQIASQLQTISEKTEEGAPAPAA